MPAVVCMLVGTQESDFVLTNDAINGAPKDSPMVHPVTIYDFWRYLVVVSSVLLCFDSRLYALRLTFVCMGVFTLWIHVAGTSDSLFFHAHSLLIV